MFTKFFFFNVWLNRKLYLFGKSILKTNHTLHKKYKNVLITKFGGLVEVESTYWWVVKLFNTQNKLMDVHQSNISKILPSSTSNLVSFIYIKSRHFTEAYLVLLHKTSHTSCILFYFWFPRASKVRLFVALLLQNYIKIVDVYMSCLLVDQSTNVYSNPLYK